MCVNYAVNLKQPSVQFYQMTTLGSFPTIPQKRRLIHFVPLEQVFLLLHKVLMLQAFYVLSKTNLQAVRL